MIRSPHYDAATYRPHGLHTGNRPWLETNCYVDLWIELLGVLGLPPEPAGVCALSADALPREWSFLKFQTDDLRRLYGLGVAEIDVWRPVVDHVVEHLEAGNLLTLETDAWFLPDTDGVSYRTEHVKTSIAPLEIDPTGRVLTYLHNAGRYTLSGDDFDGALAVDATATQVPHPYMEAITVPSERPGTDAILAETLSLALDHLDRAPGDNPAARLAAALEAELPALAERGMPYFHALSFVVTRQFGLTAQCAADGLGWLADHDAPAARTLASAASAFTSVSAQAKALQFALARIASGRRRDISPALEALVEGWGEATAAARGALTAR